MRDEITNKNFLLARSLTSEVERFLDEPLNILIRIEDIVFDRRIISDAQINEYLESIVSNSEIYDMILHVDQNGTVKHLAPFNRDILDVSISGHEYFKIVKAINRPYWSQTFISPQTGKPTLTLSMPLKDGILVGHLNLEALNSIIENVNIGTDAYAAVTDNNGITIGHMNKTLVSERFSLHSLEPILSGMSGSEGTYVYDFNGMEYLGSVSIVEQTHWIVLVAQAVDKAFASLVRIRNFILAGIICSILFALTLAVLILKRTLRPLYQLADETKRIADGDYNLSLHPTGYSEFNELLKSFTIMVNAIRDRNDELRKAHDQLEHRVEKRTAELKAIKEQAEIAKASAEQANTAKSLFLTNMSHEIRTPMNAILGFSEILETKNRDPLLLHYIRSIRDSGRSLLKLINDILDLSRIEAGKIPLEYSAISIRKFIDEITGFFVHIAEEKGIELIVGVDADLPDVISTDEIRLRQILINLIGNSLKFTDDGFIRITAGTAGECSINESEMDLIISVEDSGIGIPEEKFQSIFKEFEQLNENSIFKSEGTGLGLTITKQLVKVLNGEIGIESKINIGSTFTLIFHNVEILPPETVVKGDRAVSDFSGVVFEHAVILIVDDIKTNRDLLKGYLEEFDFELYEAAGGREAVSMIRSLHPDLVLLDMKMPDIDGNEVIRIIQEDKDTEKVSIIAVTAHAMKHDEKVITGITDSYLKKPVTRAELLNEIGKYLPATNIKTENSGVIIAPPQEELNILFSLVTNGDMYGIIDYAEEIKNLSPDYCLFADSLIKLAGEFKDQELQKFIERYR